MTYNRMKPGERRACADMAARAFADYEYFSIYVPDDKRRAYCLRAMLNTSFNAYKHSAVFLTAKRDGKIAAVAQLMPPHPPEPTVSQYLWAGFWKALLWGGYRNMAAWYDMNCRAEKPCMELPGEAWFLSVLTVEPELEGKGIGSKMLKECVIPYVKMQGGESLCLFTNSEINRRFYTKNGFEEFHAQEFLYQGRSVGSWSYRVGLQNE